MHEWPCLFTPQKNSSDPIYWWYSYIFACTEWKSCLICYSNIPRLDFKKDLWLIVNNDILKGLKSFKSLLWFDCKCAPHQRWFVALLWLQCLITPTVIFKDNVKSPLLRSDWCLLTTLQADWSVGDECGSVRLEKWRQWETWVNACVFPALSTYYVFCVLSSVS